VSDLELLRALADLNESAVAPPAGLRQRLLAEVAMPRRRFAPLFPALSELFDLGDAALGELFERAADAAQWAESPVPQVRLLHLQGGARVEGCDNGLVRIAAGARFPLHRHLGAERLLVLEGGYRDQQSGHVYTPGDLHEMPAGSEHSYVVLPERELLAAVSLLNGVDVDGFGPLTTSGPA
jgi:quercetin dioxygenase-like cupin family protein